MLLVFLLIFATSVSTYLEKEPRICDGLTPNMFSYNYLWPFEYKKGLKDSYFNVTSEKHCSDLCKTDTTCMWASYVLYTCYKGGWKDQDFSRFAIGRTFFKLHLDSETCNRTKSSLMSRTNLLHYKPLNRTYIVTRAKADHNIVQWRFWNKIINN